MQAGSGRALPAQGDRAQGGLPGHCAAPQPQPCRRFCRWGAVGTARVSVPCPLPNLNQCCPLPRTAKIAGSPPCKTGGLATQPLSGWFVAFRFAKRGRTPPKKIKLGPQQLFCCGPAFYCFLCAGPPCAGPRRAGRGTRRGQTHSPPSRRPQRYRCPLCLAAAFAARFLCWLPLRFQRLQQRLYFGGR